MKSFSELTSASQVNNGDLLAISQTSGSGYASKKITVKDIIDKSNLNLAEEYDSTSTYAVDDYVIYESVLYKCIGTTTGAFDSTKWTSVVVTDEMGSGGGGGTGGHTIIDENGNSMTARSGLQFTGNVVVTDDAINNKTIISVPSGGGHNYSTTEQIIGTWIDGKTLYEKTIDFGAIPNNTTKSVAHGINNLSMVVSWNGCMKSSDSFETVPSGENSNFRLTADATNISIRTSTSWNDWAVSYITIQYTKSS